MSELLPGCLGQTVIAPVFMQTTAEYDSIYADRVFAQIAPAAEKLLEIARANCAQCHYGTAVTRFEVNGDAINTLRSSRLRHPITFLAGQIITQCSRL